MDGIRRSLLRGGFISRSTIAASTLVLCLFGSPMVLAEPAGEVEAGAAESLTWDPAITTGSLPNGLQFFLARQERAVPELTLELVVRAGRFHEPEGHPGLARVVQRCAYEADGRSAAGSLLAEMQLRGVEIEDRFLDATMMRMTRYTLHLRQVDPETISLALRFLRLVAEGATFDDAAVARATAVVQGEHRVASGLGRRINEQVMPRLFGDSRFADRLVAIGNMPEAPPPPEAVEAFHDAWYVPGRMAIIGAGSMDGPELQEQVRAIFGDMPWRPLPADPEAGLSPFTEPVGLAVSDPELGVRAAQAIVVDHVTESRRTMEDLHRETLGRLAMEHVRSVLVEAMDSGRAPFQKVSVDVAWFPGSYRMTFAQASGMASSWEELQAALIGELRRAQSLPISDESLQTLTRAVLLDVARQAQRRRTADTGELAMRCAEAFDSDLVLMAPDEHVRRVMQALHHIDEQDVREATALNFDLSRAAYLALMPASDAQPSGAEVAAAALRAAAQAPLVASVDTTGEPLLAAPLTPGRVVQLLAHPRAEVLTAWLDNGVVLHHRQMTTTPGRARVVITLTGGQIEEQAETRGLTQHASVLWEAPATRRHGVTDLRRRLLAHDITLKGRTEEDLIRLELEGSVDDLETGLELAYLLLTEPVIDDGAFQRWQASQESVLEMRRFLPASVMVRTLWSRLLPPFDTRPRPLTVDDVRATPLQAVQDWIELLVSCAPIEVAVVGDLGREQAVDMVRRTLGALPPRAPVTASLFDELRVVERRAGGVDESVVIDSMAEQAAVLVGIPGVDAGDRHTRIALDMASFILRRRLDDALRDRGSLVGAVQVQHAPAVAYPGFGLLVATASTDPREAQVVADLMLDEITQLGREAPSPGEAQLAQLALAAQWRRSLGDPRSWADALSTSIYHDVAPEQALDEGALIEAMTAAEVSKAVASRLAADAPIRIIVTPRATDLARERQPSSR